MVKQTPDMPAYVGSEYDRLKKVVLCEPEHMTIKDVINETQRHFLKEGIDIDKALEQHRNFAKTLEQYGVEVSLLPARGKYPEQVFTRDIGFTLGQTVFVAEMASRIRQGEEDVFKEWLEKERISYFNLIGEEIEGGDIVIDRNTVYVGLSDRTNEKAAAHLKSLLPDHEVITVPFTDKFLHLDCVFNVISEDEALIFPGEIEPKALEYIKSRYHLIEVSKEEQFSLGTNVLCIGDKKIFSLTVNENVNRQLEERGFEVIEVDITEIIKSGGAFRCCTLPVLRESPGLRG